MIGVRHTGLVVSDMHRSLRFYCGLLALKEAPIADESGPFIETILGIPGVRVKTCKLAGTDGGPTLVELLEFVSHHGHVEGRKLYTVGPTHAALTVGNLDALHAKLTDAGVTFISPPQLTPDGRAKVAFCHDPDGTPLELVQMLSGTG